MGGDDGSEPSEAPEGGGAPFSARGRPPGPLELGLYPGCGFRLLLRPPRPLDDDDILGAMGLGGHRPFRSGVAVGLRVVSLTDIGRWVHVADAYGLWNDPRRRKAAVRSLARLGELFPFLLPDPDMGYAFAFYRDALRERLRVVASPCFSDQVLRIDEGQPLPGEPADWRGEPFPMMVSIARGLGIPVDQPGAERFYAWGPGR